MRNWFRMVMVAFAALLLVSGVASATQYTSFNEWAKNEVGSVPGGTPPLAAFGTLLEQWPANIFNVIGMAYDNGANSLWLANEEGIGQFYEQNAAAPHNPIRQFNILGYGLTGDGNQDGCEVDGARILITDFQGDLVLHDDIIMSANRANGALNEFWNVDGAQNPNPNGNINVILGIAVDAAGQVWVTNNEALIKRITLGAAGQWTQNSSQIVPGGGSWAEIDYDRCLNQFFVSNFQLNRHQHHNTPITPMLASFPGSGSSQTAITSNETATGNPPAGWVYTSGFGDNIIKRHEGITCQVTAVEPTTWGALKADYR
jgi:hypothetical protein